MSEENQQQPPQGEETPTLPEPNLTYIIQTFGIQAMIWTGYIPNPANEKLETNLELARFQISLLETIEEKTKGNRTKDEEEYLSAMLHNCRMAFVGARDRLSGQAAEKKETPPVGAEKTTSEVQPADKAKEQSPEEEKGEGEPKGKAEEQ